METQIRTAAHTYPNYSSEITLIEKSGITTTIIGDIIEKHALITSQCTALYERYKATEDNVPIFQRAEKYEDQINNKINNDFFGEIIDTKVGYFAGMPISYSYSASEESEDNTGSEEAVKNATKVLLDFVVRSNMYDLDMETTKLAAICGYVGRLLYHDLEGNERAMVVEPSECIFLYKSDMTEPTYAIRHFTTTDVEGKETKNVEFYDNTNIYYYSGTGELVAGEVIGHNYDYCPLFGIPNNRELMGDAEKVMSAIDAYDRTLSDANNEVEAFRLALMWFSGTNIDAETIQKSIESGAIELPDGGKAGYLTKQIDDAFLEHHLDRLEDNIYRFSKTPNLTDESFGSASGVSLKFKITGFEAKCGMFQAKMSSAGTYMFKVLASSWAKRSIQVDPLQCFMTFKRNFPQDLVSEADAGQKLMSLVSRRTALSQLSFVDDVDYELEVIEQEKDGIPSLDSDIDEDDEE